MNAVTRARLLRTPPSPWMRVGVDFVENQPGPIGIHTDATGPAAPSLWDEIAGQPGRVFGAIEGEAGKHPGLFAAGGAVVVAAAAAVVLVLVLVLRR